MTKILRKSNFFKRYLNLMLGTVWVMVGIVYLLMSDDKGLDILSVLNLLLGLFYFVLHFYLQRRNQEYIAWDEEQLILSKSQQKPVTYSLAEISQITLTESYFIVRSTPASPGETMELSGYRESDLNLLKSRFSPEKLISA